MSASEEIRRAAETVRRIDRHTATGPTAEHAAMWSPARTAHIADILEANVLWWERIEEQNSRPGDGRTRVMPNAGEAAVLRLAHAINEEQAS